MLAAVVVTRVAVSVTGTPPSPGWTASRLPLIAAVSAPSVRRLPGDVAWVWLCDESRHAQVAEMATHIEAPSGGIHVVPVQGMFDRPEASATEPIHPDVSDFITIRLDSDDALLPEPIAYAMSLAADESTLFDFPNGYQLAWDTGQMTAVDTSPLRQGPFLALVNHGRDRMTHVGGPHRDARRGRVVKRICDPAWIQVVHADNISNQLRVPKRFARWRGHPVRSVRTRERRSVLAAAGIDPTNLPIERGRAGLTGESAEDLRPA